MSDASALWSADSETCGCRCHVNATAGCDLEHDKGSSGAPGVPSCSPCAAPTCELCEGDREFGVICRRHYHWIDNTLTQIVELAALVPYHNPVGEQQRSGTPDGSPAPGNLDAMALTDRRNTSPRPNGDREDMDHKRNWNGRELESNGADVPDVVGTLASHALVVAAERDPQPDGYHPNVMESVRMLRKHRHWIAQQGWLVEAYAEDLELVHRQLAAVTRAGKWPESIGTCPNCGTRLYVTVGVDQISCRRCKAQWSGVDLVRLRLILEDQERGA